ncbi:MAG: hypothetical protein NTX87_03460 [Planctomycetota bacterium]|nr:hypothetical protein [Planctomycetota bacterium]
MKPAAIISIAVLALAAGFAAAADPLTRPEAAGVVATDDRAKLAEVEALFAAGKFGDVQEPARALLRTTKDDAVKTGAARLVAESLRKKGDWRVAAAAYAKLAERYEKGSDDQIKATATGEVLLASPTGVYPPLEAAAANAEAAAGTAAPASSSGQPAAANLADDTYLARALVCLASIRAEKLKARVVTIKRARTPQEAQAAFAALAEELRQARVLSASLSAEPEQAAAGTAGKQLADLGQQILTTLNARLAGFQAAIKRSALTLSQRKDMESYQTLCTDLAKTEGSFQTTAGKLNGLSSSSDAAKLRDDSAQRQAEYAKLAQAFVPPPMENHGGWGGGMGGGMGGGWGGGGGGGGGGRRGG